MIYYLLQRPIPAISFRSLILSHKSHPKTPPPALHSHCALSSASLSYPLATPHPFSSTMPFIPSEYRSTLRNVVLAFARVPFYPSAWRLIHVSSAHHSSLFSHVPFRPSLSLVPTHICLLFLSSRLFRFLMLIQRITFSHLPHGSSNTGLWRWAATRRGLMKNENASRDGITSQENKLNQRRRRIARKKLCNNFSSVFSIYVIKLIT